MGDRAPEGIGLPCDHGEVVLLCRYPKARGNRCHHCGEFIKQSAPPGLENSITWCAKPRECKSKWDGEHPEYTVGWVPVEDTLPGGRWDGAWENSGFRLGEANAGGGE